MNMKTSIVNYFKIVLFFCVICLLLSVQNLSAQTKTKTKDFLSSNQINWVGIYEFFDAQKGGPSNQPGNFITYSLTVSRTGDSLSARFTADGTQMSDDYECRVEPSANSLKIFFVKDLGGTEADKFKPLKKGDLLFALEKVKAGKKTRYLFRAGNFEILPLSNISKKRIYFEVKK